MKLARTAAKWTAKVGGWFWFPCPICKREFGGFEKPTADHRDSIPHLDDDTGNILMTSTIICPACTDAGWGCYTHVRLGGWMSHNCEHVQRALHHLQGVA